MNKKVTKRVSKKSYLVTVTDSHTGERRQYELSSERAHSLRRERESAGDSVSFKEVK